MSRRGPTGRTIREDAERYRFLRDQAEKGVEGPMAFYTTANGDARGVPLVGKKLDRAIDEVLWDRLEQSFVASQQGHGVGGGQP